MNTAADRASKALRRGLETAPMFDERLHAMKIRTQSAAVTAPPSKEEVAAQQAKQDSTILAALADACRRYVEGSVSLIGSLVACLTEDTWARVAAQDAAPASSFRVWSIAQMVGNGMTEASAKLYASAAEGAYQVAETGDARGWQSVTASVLANIGRASDPAVAAEAVMKAKVKKGTKIGSTAWADAIKAAPAECAARQARTTTTVAKADQLVKLAQRLAKEDDQNALILLRSAADILSKKIAAKPVG